MFDPAAFGTTIIGLDRIRREDERYARGLVAPTRLRSRRDGRHPIRHGLGASLRWIADHIDPRRLHPAPTGAD